ncbi:MAG: hypothetical protein QXO37_09530 [Candidatus Nitrosocaldaceae archaeon]
MPCDPLRPFPPTPTNFYFASYMIEFDFLADALGCREHECPERLRGLIFDNGATWSCDHIRGLGLTIYYNSDFMSDVTITLLNSFGDVNTTPTLVSVDMGEVSGLRDNNDHDTIACPYFNAIPRLIRDRLLCTSVDNDFSEGYASVGYFLSQILSTCGVEDGQYWVYVWQDDVPPNNIFQNIRCTTYYTYYTRSLGDGRLASVTGTWVFGNTRQGCSDDEHYNHFVPIMYVTTCARMFVRGYPTNTKEDYEVLKGLTLGTVAWEADRDVDILRKLQVVLGR